MLFTFLEYDHSFSSKCHLGVIPKKTYKRMSASNASPGMYAYG